MNFVDFDMHFGHRRDVAGYSNALHELDARMPEFMAKLKDGDLVVITADHGCDPTAPGSDHTREHIPMIFFGPNVAAAGTADRVDLLRHRRHAGQTPRRQTSLQRNRTAMTQNLDFKRNTAVGLDLGWVNSIKVNRNAADRRAASLANRRTVKKEYQAAWLIRAVQCMDLTTLGGDDTPGRVERLCMKAMRPLRADLMQALGLETLTTGAVCVYHEMITPAVKILQGRLPIAAVSTAFPAGLSSMETKLREIELSRRRRRDRDRHRHHPPARVDR